MWFSLICALRARNDLVSIISPCRIGLVGIDQVGGDLDLKVRGVIPVQKVAPSAAALIAAA